MELALQIQKNDINVSVTQLQRLATGVAAAGSRRASHVAIDADATVYDPNGTEL